MKKWTVSEPVNTEKNAFTIVDENGIYIAEMFCGGAELNQAEPEEAEANARLMSCADELLEALKIAKHKLNEHYNDNEIEELSVIKQAIEKAEVQS